VLPKPEACKGCPFYGDGKGFVPDEIRDDKEVFIYAQNPGEDEEKGYKVIGYDGKRPVYEQWVQPAPLLGRTGYVTETQYMKMASLERKDVSMGNALRCRYKHTNNLPPLQAVEVKEAIKHCHQAHFKLPKATKLIVAMGEYALYALTGEYNISEWRGYVLSFPPVPNSIKVYTPTLHVAPFNNLLPVLAVNHVAAIFRAPSLSLFAKADWAKITRILNGEWPKPPPPIYTKQNLMWPREFAFDTEFIPETGKLIRYSMAWRNIVDKKIRVHVVEADNIEPGYSVVLLRPKLITQNALADIAHFQTISGLKREGFDLEDIMHIHAVLCPYNLSNVPLTFPG